MIITNNEKQLRVKCEPAADEYDASELIFLLEKNLEMSASSGNPGIGLACPQIGIAKNVAIIRINDKYKVDLVNCRIQDYYDEFLFKGEGCLSFPGVICDTKRFNEIHVVDNLLYPHSFVATGIFSVAIQHELDHLNGVLLVDKLNKKDNIKQKPNELCLCGSGKKYKKCCYLK